MEAMTSIATKRIVEAWDILQSLVPGSPIGTEQQYDHAVAKLNELLDLVDNDVAHPLYELLDALSILIRALSKRFGVSPATFI